VAVRHLYPDEMDRYADRLDDAATNGDAAKMRPDDNEDEDEDKPVYLGIHWRARRDSNPQPSDP
jgi:hypothetical protein